MSHQAEDVDRLAGHPRILVMNDLGTGKTPTVAWWLQEHWISGSVDFAIVVGPSMVIDGWRETMDGGAWADGSVEFIDARPPNTDDIVRLLTSKVPIRRYPFIVMFTTYAVMRRLFTKTYRRQYVGIGGVIEQRLPNLKLALVCDEAHSAALPGTGQGTACRYIGSMAAAVAGVTATPIGRATHLRPWGLTKLVRPDVLDRIPPSNAYGAPPPRGSFEAFKARYGFLSDPNSKSGQINLSRAIVLDVDRGKLEREFLTMVAPFSCHRTKEECLDLPEKVYLRRSVDMDRDVARLMTGLLEEDRAIMGDGHVVVPSNVLESRLRTLELAGGWLDGRPAHCLKLDLLREVLSEIEGPTLVWCSRTRTLLGAALVAAGFTPQEALDRASRAHPPAADEDGEARVDSREYRAIIAAARSAGVGVIHGPTKDADRDETQSAWRSGEIRTVIANPGVAGAGLNWQHVVASVYYDQPLGMILRQQSEDRVHRHGLKHTALYYDLYLSGGPDEAVAMAHSEQISTEAAMLEWLSTAIDGMTG